MSRKHAAGTHSLARPTWAAISSLMVCSLSWSQTPTPGQAGEPYANMPRIAPPGVQIGAYLPVPADAQGAPVDATKGYRTQDLGKGLYLVTDNIYQSLFLVHKGGVIVIDAPPSLAMHIREAIAEITDKRITHLIYSHSHKDHIGGASSLGFHGPIIAHEMTRAALVKAHDSDRPIPTLTFRSHYDLKVGGQLLRLSYRGYGQTPGNIYVYAPAQKVLMVVDVIFPGWMPYRNLALAQDIPGLIRQIDEIARMPFDILVGGHVTRVGTRADVLVQAEFMRDLVTVSTAALKQTTFGPTFNPSDQSNAWAMADSYIDRAAIRCVNAMTEKWETRLAGFDAYIWDQCFTMQESIRAD
jgi:glyoxylase-like metal-dependent hydrolase (beta-lactamase superfamily II)